MIQIQATFSGFSGQPCSLFSVYDHDSSVLVISAEAPYRTERRQDCLILTNVPSISRDKLFTNDDLLPSITAYYALKNGVATDGKESRLAFGERASRANPSSAIEQDGYDQNGPKYRVNADITNSQVAVLMTCLHTVRSDAIEQTVEMVDILRVLLRGQVFTI